MKILYIVIGNLGNTNSGSGLRPHCMHRAFLERGHTIYTLSGYAGRSEGKLRAAEVEKAKHWAEENKPDLCYIESSTYPLFHQCDYHMIHWLHKKKIPTAYFYRDFYRSFPDLFPRRKGMVNSLKELYLDIMQSRTDRILHKVDIVYFPSRQCFPYYQYKKMRALPPAGQLEFLSAHDSNKTCIYVGGVSEFYGFPLMLEAFKMLNQEETKYKLILVCRKAEHQELMQEAPAFDWLEVHHVSGDDLIPLYAKADIGLLALTKNPYSDLAIGTKLYQYLSFGLPVLSTDVDAMREIIENNHFGVISSHEPHQFADAIREMLSDEENLKGYRESVECNMAAGNLWVHRVDQIVKDLLG